MKDLTADDFYRILQEPSNAMVKQYKALLETENVKLEFSDDALKRISALAEEANKRTDNIGARRLHTVMERLLEDISFNADLKRGETVTITKEFVDERLGGIIEDQDLTRYIL